MDAAKRDSLIAVQQQRSSADQIVEVDQFFDGNDDLGSIGCNLIEHPGVDKFREVLASLQTRPDVDFVWVRITDLDPGEGCWPSTDTVFVIGSITADELREAVAVLQPDEVGLAAGFDVPPSLQRYPDHQILVIWWD